MWINILLRSSKACTSTSSLPQTTWLGWLVGLAGGAGRLEKDACSMHRVLLAFACITKTFGSVGLAVEDSG